MTLRSVWNIAREALVNIALPLLIYSLAQRRFGDVNALMASSAPPILWNVIEFVRNRRLDTLSLLVMLGIALSLVAFYGGGSVRFLQLRERLVTITIALVFLGSAAIGRPLMYEVVRAFLARSNDPELERIESLRHSSGLKRAMMIMTLVWGLGLLFDGAVSIALVYVLPIRTYLVVNPILGYATIGSLTLWNLSYGRSRRRANKVANQESSKPADLRLQNQRG